MSLLLYTLMTSLQHRISLMILPLIPYRNRFQKDPAALNHKESQGRQNVHANRQDNHPYKTWLERQTNDSCPKVNIIRRRHVNPTDDRPFKMFPWDSLAPCHSSPSSPKRRIVLPDAIRLENQPDEVPYKTAMLP